MERGKTWGELSTATGCPPGHGVSFLGDITNNSTWSRATCATWPCWSRKAGIEPRGQYTSVLLWFWEFYSVLIQKNVFLIPSTNPFFQVMPNISHSLTIHCCVVFSGWFCRLFSSPLFQLFKPPSPTWTTVLSSASPHREDAPGPELAPVCVLYWRGQNWTENFRCGPHSAKCECPEYIHLSPLCHFHSLHFAIQLPFLLCAVIYSYWQSSQD